MKKKQSIDIGHIDTTVGICPGCQEEALLVSLVQDYYKCTNCGEETKQYVNGHIKYVRLSDEDHKWLKNLTPRG